jgi:hypothetical protein
MSKDTDYCLHSDCQGEELLFCSVGFEQHWGQCSTEYRRLIVKKLDLNWKTWSQDSVLRNQCPAEDRVLIEHLLCLAQAELVVLNLASTTIAVEGRKILIRSG